MKLKQNYKNKILKNFYIGFFLIVLSALGCLNINCFQLTNSLQPNIEEYQHSDTNLKNLIEPIKSESSSILERNLQDKVHQKQIFPKYLWVYNNSSVQENIYEKFLLSALYKNSLQSSYKMILLDETTISHLFSEDILKNVLVKIKQRIPKQNHNKTFRDWVKLQVLARHGGIFVDQNIFLAQSLKKIEEHILHLPMMNRWDQTPQVFMLRSDQTNQQKAIIFNNFYHSDIEQAWKVQYDIGFIATIRGSKLMRQLSQKFNLLLGISDNITAPQSTLSQQQFVSKCLNVDTQLNSQNNLSSSQISMQNTLKCVLNHRQHHLDRQAFNLQKQLDFISTARYYKIWSLNSSHYLHQVQAQQSVGPLNKMINIYDETEQTSLSKSSLVQVIRSQKSTKYLQPKQTQISNNYWMIQFKKLPEEKANNITLNHTSKIESLCQKIDKFMQQKISLVNEKTQQLQNQQLIAQAQQDKQRNKHRLEIPKQIFVYSSGIQNQRLLHQVNIKNIEQYASKNNYKFILLNQQTFNQFVPQKVVDDIRRLITHLQQKLQFYKQEGNRSWFYAEKADQLNQNMDKIKARLIVYHVIHYNGGIFYGKQLTLVQNLQKWVENVMIEKKLYVNCGNKDKIKPKYVGFYHSDYSAIKSQENITREYDIEKQVILYPSIEDHFFAGVKQGQLLKEMIDLYMDILFRQRSAFAYEIINNTVNTIGKTDLGHFFSQAHRIALHAVLHKRQRQIDRELTPLNGYRNLAIDEYGLVTINMYTSTHKHDKYCHRDRNRCYIRMSKLTLAQFQYETGPMQFAIRIDDELAGHIEWKMRTFNQTQTDYILKKSFVNLFVVDIAIKNKMIENPITIKDIQFQKEVKSQQVDPVGKQWTKLDKNIWVIWDTGIEGHSSIFAQLAFDNLKRSASKSGFTVHSVNQNNIYQLLDKQMMTKINNAVKTASFQISKQGITDAWRMALVLQHGGVYLDASSFTTGGNFDWLKYVTRLPKNLLWNRYGQEPDAIIHFNEHYGAPLQWHFDQVHLTKSQWSLSYENNFFAAVKGSQFIKQWLDVFLQWIVIPENQVHEQMKMANTWNTDRWLEPGNRYLTAMQGMKYVMGRKQKQIEQNKDYQKKWRNAPHYFKVWSFSGHMIGQQKLRDQNAYENMDYRQQQKIYRNYFRFKYSMQWSQSVMGKVKYQSKLFNYDTKFSNQLFQRAYRMTKDQPNTTIDQAITQVIHPKSIFANVFDLQIKMPQLMKFYLGKDEIQRQRLQKLRKKQMNKKMYQQKEQIKRKYKYIGSIWI